MAVSNQFEQSGKGSAENSLLAQAIDHTRLTFASDEDEAASIARLCEEARHYGFFSVCVRPRHVAFCKKALVDSDVKVATVIGFPLTKVKLEAEKIQPTVGGFSVTEKVAETRQAVLEGVDELDLVINVAQLKTDVSQGSDGACQELAAIREAAQGTPIKVIIETDLLSEAEIVQASRWCGELGIFMVKTSTGMVEGGYGATLHAVGLIQDTLRAMNSQTLIKASGGIKNRAQAQEMLNAGANRLGTSSGIAIVQDALEKADSGY